MEKEEKDILQKLLNRMEKLEDKIENIDDKLETIENKVDNLQTEVSGIKVEHGALLRGLEENTRVTRAILERMQFDQAKMHGIQERQQKIIELLSEKSIEHEAEIRVLKEARA